MLTLLRQRNYALLWVGGLISVLGDWVFIAARSIIISCRARATAA